MVFEVNNRLKNIKLLMIRVALYKIVKFFWCLIDVLPEMPEHM